MSKQILSPRYTQSFLIRHKTLAKNKANIIKILKKMLKCLKKCDLPLKSDVDEGNIKINFLPSHACKR